MQKDISRFGAWRSVGIQKPAKRFLKEVPMAIGSAIIPMAIGTIRPEFETLVEGVIPAIQFSGGKDL